MKLIDKYEPRCINDLTVSDPATFNILKALASGRMSGHVILHGTNGVGKSSAAKLLIDAIGGQYPSVERISAQQLLRKVDLDTYLAQAAHLASLTTSNKHFVLLNEFDEETGNLHLLWQAMDRCQAGLMVLITTNELMKIHPSIRSRCYVLHFPPVTALEILPTAERILALEGLPMDPAVLLAHLQTREYFGDLRKYFEILESLLYVHKSTQLITQNLLSSNAPSNSVII